MSANDERYLNGTHLSEVWAKVKSHVSTQLANYETKANVAIMDQALTSAIGDIKASLGTAAYQDISIFASAEDMGVAQNDITAIKASVSTLQGYFSSGSAKTAVKLLTPRSIWGKSFDGSADISGALTGVTTINGFVTFNTSASLLSISGKISATGNIESSAGNIEASNGGISAYGIADLSIGGGGVGGLVTAVKVGSTTYSPSSGVVSLPAYPTLNYVTHSQITANATTITPSLNVSAHTCDLYSVYVSSGTTRYITLSTSGVSNVVYPYLRLVRIENASSATLYVRFASGMQSGYFAPSNDYPLDSGDTLMVLVTWDSSSNIPYFFALGTSSHYF